MRYVVDSKMHTNDVWRFESVVLAAWMAVLSRILAVRYESARASLQYAINWINKPTQTIDFGDLLNL